MLWLVEMNHYRAIVTSPDNYRMSLEIVLQKEVSEGNSKHFVSYSRSSLLSESSFWWMIFNMAELFFKMATTFVNLLNIVKKLDR